MLDLHMKEPVPRRIMFDPGQQIVGDAQYRVRIPYGFVGGKFGPLRHVSTDSCDALRILGPKGCN
jgi:hypothetical protein